MAWDGLPSPAVACETCQCGGKLWLGASQCVGGWNCVYQGEDRSTCLQSGGQKPPPRFHFPEYKALPAEWPSLFCWAVVTPHTGEEWIMLKNFELNMGIFACNAHRVVSNVTVQKLLPKQGKAVYAGIDFKTLKMPLFAPKREVEQGHFHIANAPIFAKIWEAVLKEGTWKKYEWTAKVDVDAVMIPSRVRLLLNDVPRLPPKGGAKYGEYEPVYLENDIKDMSGNHLHGPVEVFSRQAMWIYEAKQSRCRDDLEYKELGEDVWMNKCMQLLQIKPRMTMRLLFDTYAEGVPKVPCTDPFMLNSRKPALEFAVFHAAKDSGLQQECLFNLGVPIRHYLRVNKEEGWEPCYTTWGRGNHPGQQCIFPFKYQGQTFKKCTTFQDSQPWCAFMVDYKGNAIPNMWGTCEDKPACHGIKPKPKAPKTKAEKKAMEEEKEAKKAKAAEKKAAEAEKKAKEAEKKQKAAEKKAEQKLKAAEKKKAEAEEKAKEAERKAKKDEKRAREKERKQKEAEDDGDEEGSEAKGHRAKDVDLFAQGPLRAAAGARLPAVAASTGAAALLAMAAGALVFRRRSAQAAGPRSYGECPEGPEDVLLQSGQPLEASSA